jgi:hypothetical protein
MIPLSLIMAIATVESGGNPKAVGARGELGLLQISAGVVEDCNRLQSVVHFEHADALIAERAVAMFRIYVGHYATKERFGMDVTPFLIARLWNGGARGWNHFSTLTYGMRVANLAYRYDEEPGEMATIGPADWQMMFLRERLGAHPNTIPEQIRSALNQPTSGADAKHQRQAMGQGAH